MNDTKHTDCPLVIIHWEDSRQPVGAWQFLNDIPTPTPVVCASVGWLLRDDPECKLLCPNMGDVDSENPQGSGMISIPGSCILKIERLSEESS